MLALLAGLPTRFFDWCEFAIGRVAENSYGSMAQVRANTLEEIATESIRSLSPNLVVGSVRPSPRVLLSFANCSRRFVVILDDPRQALYHLVVGQGVGFADAVRAVASGCASLCAAIGLDKALIVRGWQGADDPASAVLTMAGHLGLKAGDMNFAEIVRPLRGGNASDEANLSNDWWTALDDRLSRVALGAFGGYLGAINGGQTGAIIWESDLFFLGETIDAGPPMAAVESIDVTGRRRCLLYGPYIALPVGTWTASIFLTLSQEAAEVSYLIEVVAGSQLAQTRLDTGSSENVTIELEFTIDETMEKPVEIRIWNETAAFDGFVTFDHVCLTLRTPCASNHQVGGWST